jgi:predicted house-cleaning noncanonical NTP pyrophosphatase (MazG superfamily)
LVPKYEKAVRNRIPEIIKADGRNCEFVVLDDASFLQEMNKKLSEEMSEYNKNNSIEEIVDILEVAYRIAELQGYNKEIIEKIRKRKNIERGNFSDNIFLVSST